MAKIYPSRIPDFILDDPLKRAELQVYKALKELPDPFYVFYSIHWQDHNDYSGVSEGEADFVIVHPDMGIIVLEVKGGGIYFRAEKDQWYSQGGGGAEYEIKDPVEQGRRNHYKLKNALKAFPAWPLEDFNIWHAVCFPDIHLVSNQSLKTDLPRQTVIDCEDLNDILKTINRLFEFLFEKNLAKGAPGPDRMQMILDLLVCSIDITTPLGVEFEKEDEKLIQLTEQQFRALSLLGDRKRAAIAGCAGSGKTMLAVNKAQQFSKLGLNTLLVCFNIALSEDLKQRLPGIDVYNFHELCVLAAKQAKLSVRHVGDDQVYFDQVLPQALMDASSEIGPIYDAIIVDEGQDFRENYWIALESLLKKDGYLYIFYDNNQDLFSGTSDFSGLISEPPFILNQNCRNTKSIHSIVSRFHSDPTSIFCFGPDGQKPEIIKYSDEDDELGLLQKSLHRLIVDEGIGNSDIVILTPRGEDKTILKPGLKLGMFTISEHPPMHQTLIQATSVFRFKGLERRVVILAEVDKNTRFKRDMVMYVGCSRARTYLIILTDEDAPEKITERIKSES
jgi:hypothetical protein